MEKKKKKNASASASSAHDSFETKSRLRRRLDSGDDFLRSNSFDRVITACAFQHTTTQTWTFARFALSMMQRCKQMMQRWESNQVTFGMWTHNRLSCPVLPCLVLLEVPIFAPADDTPPPALPPVVGFMCSDL